MPHCESQRPQAPQGLILHGVPGGFVAAVAVVVVVVVVVVVLVVVVVVAMGARVWRQGRSLHTRWAVPASDARAKAFPMRVACAACAAVAGHGRPPKRGRRRTFAQRCCSPPPQLRSHAAHGSRSNAQSTGHGSAPPLAAELSSPGGAEAEVAVLHRRASSRAAERAGWGMHGATPSPTAWLSARLRRETPVPQAALQGPHADHELSGQGVGRGAGVGDVVGASVGCGVGAGVGGTVSGASVGRGGAAVVDAGARGGIVIVVRAGVGCTVWRGVGTGAGVGHGLVLHRRFGAAGHRTAPAPSGLRSTASPCVCTPTPHGTLQAPQAPRSK